MDVPPLVRNPAKIHRDTGLSVPGICELWKILLFLQLNPVILS